ncbi:hypothetical protein L6270_01900 [Candidatus Parcubacteria bacterium]|nr:hypothetical protein [Patescibacteria group bacterium]MBU4309887.1 hypothetical protein [Patescibacteria group bacterium]MBU4431895.1 hypothetical protein [Patescibacteria group bacterium]MBU4578226.1 hypothetical protein [Patescibacteria group bacterium]MCG2696762.1 hypothetical protein [Candidatus Parcubacteria bacterium]
MSYSELGEVVAQVCGGKPWSDCWCGAKERSGGCRNCQTYQLMYGLGPTCGDDGKPTKYIASRNGSFTITDEELIKLVETQKRMKTKGYK